MARSKSKGTNSYSPSNQPSYRSEKARSQNPYNRSLPSSETTVLIRPLAFDPIPRVVSPLTEIEDRRRYGFPSAPGPRTTRGIPARLTSRPPRRPNVPRDGFQTFQQGEALRQWNRDVVAFENRKKTVVCIRRWMRKQVLHALGVAGQGGHFKFPYRRNENSGIHC